MNRKIHIVPHTHWDKEWYFTTARSKVYLMKNIKDIIHILETNPDFRYFTLDGQSSLLDDYLKWCPQDLERIKKLVQDKRLKIGPWYTQTDQMLVSGESLVRNLYYGIKTCEKLGDYMKVAYVPDSFGQAGNMPQIYQQFHIEDTLFWRGVSDDMVKYTDFQWCGDDGTIVFATQMPKGYYIGAIISKEDKFWQRACFNQVGNKSTTRHIYFPNGFDQSPICTRLPQIVKERNEKDHQNDYVISCIEDYIQDVKSENLQLETIHGELVISKNMRIHKSIYSSRSDLKILNTQVQNYITNILEPFLTISYQLGNDYPHQAIEDIWKLLLENAAHDSMGSCISDNANEDVYMRYKQAYDIAVNFIELHSRLIATQIKQSDINMTLTLFNTLPYQRSETLIVKTYIPSDHFFIIDSNGQKTPYTIIDKKDVTDYVLKQMINLDPSCHFYIPENVYEATMALQVQKIPSMGYKQYNFHIEKSHELILESRDYLENEYYIIIVEDSGSLTIYDKENQYAYTNQAIIVEDGDDGDSFNYSPPRHDLKVYSNKSIYYSKIEGSEIYQRISFHFDMSIPAHLNERKKGQTSVLLPVDMSVILKKDSKVIDFHIHIQNQGLSHRLSILFDSHMMTKTNFADQQFGCIQRPNIHEKEMTLYLQDKKENNQWQESPISIEPMQTYVSLTDQRRGIAILPKGVREYEIIDNHIIRLTLMRTYGFMGKEDLIYRPGRASGESVIETPNAQLLKDIDIDFGVVTYASSFNEANIDTIAKRYNTDILTYTYAPYLNGRLIFPLEKTRGNNESVYSLFNTQNKLVVSVIKKAEDKEGIIIRLYNGKYHCPVQETISFHYPIQEAYYTNLKEEKQEKIDIMNNEIKTKTLLHCQFMTIYIK